MKQMCQNIDTKLLRQQIELFVGGVLDLPLDLTLEVVVAAPRTLVFAGPGFSEEFDYCLKSLRFLKELEFLERCLFAAGVAVKSL